MTPHAHEVSHDLHALLVSADPALGQALAAQFASPLRGRGRAGGGLAAVVRLSQARTHFRLSAPAVIVLDESACATGVFGAGAETPVVAAAKEMAQTAPVVLVAVALRPVELEALGSLVSSGRLDIVTRAGEFHALVAGLVDRRLAEAAPALGTAAYGAVIEGFEAEDDFGEILRHELNNPLTGILGNAELLLARQEQFSTAAVRRLETIAELAVRMRETVRRLSSAWKATADAARAHSR